MEQGRRVLVQGIPAAQTGHGVVFQVVPCFRQTAQDFQPYPQDNEDNCRGGEEKFQRVEEVPPAGVGGLYRKAQKQKQGTPAQGDAQKPPGMIEDENRHSHEEHEEREGLMGGVPHGPQQDGDQQRRGGQQIEKAGASLAVLGQDKPLKEVQGQEVEQKPEGPQVQQFPAAEKRLGEDVRNAQRQSGHSQHMDCQTVFPVDFLSPNHKLF